MSQDATTNCQQCGANFPYEPIVIGNTDFGKVVAKHCPRCVDEQREALAADSIAAMKERHAERVRAVIPPDLRQTRTGHHDFNATLWAAVKQWTPGIDGEWLGIVGPAGKCKTRCLALLAWQMIQDEKNVVWTSACRLQEATEDRRSRDIHVATHAREHIAECMDAAVLIIDDLGKNTWSIDFERTLFQLLDHRKNFRLPILWSSNIHPDHFTGLSLGYAAPIIGRLIERTLVIDLDSERNAA